MSERSYHGATSRSQKKEDFMGTINISPQCKIPPVAYLTPCQTFCFVCVCAGVRSGRLTALLARYPAVFSRFLTVLVEMVLLGIQLSLKIVLLEKGQRGTSRFNALSSRGDVLRGCHGRFLSLTSLVCWYYRTSRLFTV